MTPVTVSERAFEDAIERALMGEPHARSGNGGMIREVPEIPYGDAFVPGGYHRRSSKTDYDRDRCLIPPRCHRFPHRDTAAYLEPPETAPRRRCPGAGS